MIHQFITYKEHFIVFLSRNVYLDAAVLNFNLIMLFSIL